MTDASGESDFSFHKSLTRVRGCHLSVCPDVTSNSSHSFEARELRFASQTPHINAKKLWRDI